jgi:hypothetical protein
MNHPGRLAPAAVALIALTLSAGCSSSDSEASDTAPLGSTVEVATSAETTVPSTSAASTTSTTELSADSTQATAAPSSVADPSTPASNTTPPPDSVDISDAAACFAARWNVLPDQIEQIFHQGAFASLPLDVTVEGLGTLDARPDGTYTYVPDFTITLSLNDSPPGIGAWSGTVEGTWSIDGQTLTMAHTSNTTTGAIDVYGQSIPLPAVETFDGTATLIECSPETVTVETSTPAGPLQQTMVLAP